MDKELEIPFDSSVELEFEIELDCEKLTVSALSHVLAQLLDSSSEASTEADHTFSSPAEAVSVVVRVKEPPLLPPEEDVLELSVLDVESDVVLRTHTSNVQVHLMEQQNPPIRYIVPGRVYRNEAIGYKSYCLFHQVEGIYINNNVSFGELKGCLEYFIKQMFGPKKKMRFRPSYFPFTEPSAEVDIWDEERNKWMEILGCGMVDPAVLENVGYDSTNLRGYAFGMGVERIAMLKHRVDDIRHFYTGDLRFLEQFI